MECPNCSFQNSPGLKACVRCSSSLDFSGVDYVPPRSRGRRAAHVRQITDRVAFGLSNRAAWIGAGLRELLSPQVDRSVLLWSVIPGLGHIRSGRNRFGWIFLVTWLVLLALTAGFAGSGAAWLWYLGAVGLHCLVVGLVLARALQTRSIVVRLAIGLLLYVALSLGLYAPGRWFISNVASAVEIRRIRANETLHDGDTIVRSGAWLRPDRWQPGDLVFYRVRAASAPGVVIRSGFGLDRVLATSGDVVVIESGRLLVNGMELAAWQMPLGTLRRMPDLTITVPDRSYLILPSTLRIDVLGNQYQSQWRELLLETSVVRENDVLGTVWWRLRPWSRFGSLE